MRGRQASRDRMEVGVEKKLFMVHLWTLCQKPFMPMPVVVGRVEGGGEPVSQPSDYLGGPEEVVF